MFYDHLGDPLSRAMTSGGIGLARNGAVTQNKKLLWLPALTDFCHHGTELIIRHKALFRRSQRFDLLEDGAVVFLARIETQFFDLVFDIGESGESDWLDTACGRVS